VRVGFANILRSPWTILKLIGRASTTINDYVNPTGDTAWTTFTFASRGGADDRIVTNQDAPTQIIVAGVAVDVATGLSNEPAWTWTDWVPLTSAGPDSAHGFRVLMLRALVPSGQSVCFANGLLRKLTGNTALNAGFDSFIGGIKRNCDRVTDPSLPRDESTDIWSGNTLTSGSLMPIVQFLTRRAGLVGMVAGDSHQQGTSTTAQFASFGYRASACLGAAQVGVLPMGMVNCAVGGATSAQFFSRLDTLLPIVRPSYVVLPGWTFNDRNGELHADRTAMNVFFTRLLNCIETCQQRGILAIVLTPFPRDRLSMTPAQLEPWRWLRQAIINLSHGNIAVLDATALLGNQADGEFDGTYLPSLSDDGKHPNDSGHAALGATLIQIIQSMLGKQRGAIE
jgi:hypothetical protein